MQAPIQTRKPPRPTNLVGVGADGDAERAREAEVGQLQLALAVNEQVLGLEVAVEHAVVVAEGHAVEELVVGLGLLCEVRWWMPGGKMCA